MSTPMMSSSALSAVSQAKAQERYLRFGQFQVDLQREALFKEGSRVRIPSKVFQVLMALIERPGEIVTRDALRARLWPCGTFVNYNANVNTTVNKLRLALGDSPDKPMYVETIPRHGYCFLRNVERADGLLKTSGLLTIAEPETVATAGERQTAASRFARVRNSRLAALFANGWGAAILLSGVLLGVGVVLFLHRPS
jgi:DNA-binding winged helix-turn-helix (wHTH) protein